MKRIYHKYTDWECYKNGMFEVKTINSLEFYELEGLAVKLLSNENDFFNAGIRLISEWKVSCEENLTNIRQNRVAYIGQACCCLVHGVPESITKQAWKNIPEEIQIKANKVAENIIKIYERQNKQVYKGLGNQLLFEWDS